MLDTLRQHSKSALIYVFFAIIIVVFVFSFGPGSSGCQGRSGSVETFAAKVNGETITYQDFMARYSRMFRDYQNRGGGQFNEEMARAIKLKDRVLDQMIDMELLSQAARQSGVAVSDKELAESLRKSFAPDGKFDEKIYRQTIEYQLNTTTWQFEDQERRRLAAQKMISSVAASAKVSDEEVRAEYSREKEKLDVTYVRFAPASFKADVARPDDAAAEAYAKANPAKIEQAYKANQARFNKPERVRASHILIKLDEKATDAQADEAKKKLLEVKAKIVAGADFATEAKAISDDPGSKENGGDLGAFGRGSMVAPFEQAAFALKPGELSEPVRTKFGYHLIKVAEVLPAENKSLEAASKELAIEAIIEDGAKALAQKKAEETLAQAKEGKKLEELWPPEEKKAEPQQPGMLRFDVGGTKPAAAVTGPFSPANDYIPQIGVDAALSRALLSLDEKKPLVEKPFEVNGSFYVVALKAHERADFKELEAKMDEYREKARQKKVNEGLESFLKGLKDQAKIEKNDALLYGAAPAGAVAFDG